MNQFTSMRVEIWRDGSGKNMFALMADLPKDEMLVKKTVWGETYSGLSRVWFVLTEVELSTWANSGGGQYQDGIHMMDVCGDVCMFYDSLVYQDSTTKKFGVAEVPYYRATIPMFFRKLLHRVAKKIWGQLRIAQSMMDQGERYRSPRCELSFDSKYRARIERLYGQGKGDVRLEYGYEPERHAKAIELELARERQNPLPSQRSFTLKLAHVMQIARNSTYGFHETASVAICVDGQRYVDGKPVERADGFYWVVRGPDGKTIMNGGILNHSRDEGGSDWSIHT